MLYSEIVIDESLGYIELFIPIKVKLIGGHCTEQDLESVYKSLVDCGEITQHIEEHLLSKVVGEHRIGINNYCVHELNVSIENI